MRVFLEVQRSTMLAYFAGRAPARTALAPLSHREQSEALEGAGRGGERPAPPAQWGEVPERSIPRPAPAESHATSSAEPASSPPSRDATGEPAPNGVVRHPGHATVSRSAHDGRAAGEAVTALAVASSPVGTASLGRELITNRLLEIVRDRTGYPIETLGLDLDMEADLGIDSIKRVEILGKLRDEFPSLKVLSESTDAMEALGRARTLGMIAERMASVGEQASPPPKPTQLDERAAGVHVAVAASAREGVHHRALRRLVEAIEAPQPRERFGLMEAGRVIVTDDGRGISALLAERLEAANVLTERLGGLYDPVDWSSQSSIEAAVERLRARGPIAGILHALPLAEEATSSHLQQEWRGRVNHEVRGLFLLAKAVAPDLEAAAQAGGACLIAATALGGRFGGAGSANRDFIPGHGGVVGLVKTLAREWPKIRSRVVDFSIKEPIGLIADRLASEIFIGDGWAEIGYDHGRRVRLRTVESPLEHAAPSLELKPGDPVLISGGARGITALVAAELARTWRPTLLIVGTTPFPEELEPADTAALRGETELKSALHAGLCAAGRRAGPAEIETAYQSLRRVREVRENLAILKKTGATIEYAQVDVRDPRALSGVLEGWRARYGDFAGLIHGAGLIKDKLIRHKTVESFDRVLGTKIDGALNLVRLARPEALKFVVLFSSIAGRFGNVGQSDYAAANEILNKLALWLDRRWPGRVLSAIWGPWSGVGMVSQLESHLGRRGLGMITPEVGRGLLIEELRYGKKGEVEVVYTGELGTLEQPIVWEAVPEPAEAAT
jgi:NAD(P)-dependent dehydrogenase (short-subunit alcohol dehydrogenase family)